MSGYCVESKIDIGVHKHLELEQEEYCFDVCMDDEGASLLKNSREQSVVEKLRDLLIFGVNDKRYINMEMSKDTGKYPQGILAFLIA